MAQYAETTATARRRRRPPPTAVALAAVGALGAAAVLTGVVELPDFAAALEGLTASLGAWTYLLVPALGFLETGAFVGLLVLGETAVLVGGVVAERGGVALVPLIGLVWLGAFGGDVVSFLIGRRLGRSFLERHGRRLGIAQLRRVERFFSRFGGRALRDIPTREGFDRDEYPPAVGRGRGPGLERGRNPRGWKADVHYVPSSENRSHGATLGDRLEPLWQP